MVLHKFNSPGYKKTGTFQSLSFLQSCLYIKDTQTKWNGPGYAGKRFAYPYYTISPLHSASKLLRFWRNATDPACNFMHYALVSGSRELRFSPVLSRFQGIRADYTFALRWFYAASPIPDPGLFLHLYKSYPAKTKRTG